LTEEDVGYVMRNAIGIIQIVRSEIKQTVCLSLLESGIHEQQTTA